MTAVPTVDPIGRFSYQKHSTEVGRRWYVGLVGVTALVAVSQFLITPRFLDSVNLGIFSLCLSASQAFLQFGDLGFANAASRISLNRQLRSEFRETGYSIGSFTALLAVGTLTGLSVARLLDPVTAGCLALSVIGAWFCLASKMRASGYTEAADERASAQVALIWQNSQKLGQIVGSVTGSAALACGLGALTSLLSRPVLPHPRISARFVGSTTRIWASGLTLVTAAFAITWTDTYLVTAILGLSDAGDYQAILRPLLGVSYLYLPALGLIQVAINSGNMARAWRICLGSVFAIVLGLLAVGAILIFAGSSIWPSYSFPPAVVVGCGLSVFLSGCSASYGVFLLTDGRQGLAALFTISGSALILVSGLFLIPEFGLLGAAYSSVLGWSVPATAQLTLALVRQRQTG